MLKDLLYVGIGGAIGSILRYLVSLAVKYGGTGFPWATFIVNIAGCLVIGLIFGITSRNPNFSSHLNLLLAVGLCGGFTTFSTFSKECLQLLQTGNHWMCALYIVGSVVIGVAATAIGYILTK
ncbi:MAG: fluoride efflux transporter CrcB [Muribaculaceae bacterium]|nr:fluoride efflux transporter CrcB [Muribaculaceae bacterium]